MAQPFLYLTTIGRKSGEPRQIEIWFVEHAGRYYMVSEAREESNWVKNILKTPAVTFSIGTRANQGSVRPSTPALGRIITPEREPELCAQVRRLMDDKYQWSEGLVVELTPVSS